MLSLGRYLGTSASGPPRVEVSALAAQAALGAVDGGASTPDALDLFASGGSLRMPEGNANMGIDEYIGWATQPLGGTSLDGWFLADGAMFAVVHIPLAETQLNQRYGLMGREPGGANRAGIYFHGGSWNVSGRRNVLAGHVRKQGQSELTVYSAAVTEERILIVFKRASGNFSIDWYSLNTGTKNAGATTGGAANGMANFDFNIGLGYMVDANLFAAPTWGTVAARTTATIWQAWPGEIEACGYVAGNVSDATWQAIALGGEYSANLTAADMRLFRDFREAWTFDEAFPGRRDVARPDWATGDNSTDAARVWRNTAGAGGATRGSHIRRQATTDYLTITAKGNGFVHGLTVGAASRSIPFSGTSDQNGETVQVQVVDALTGDVRVDWTNCGTVTAGAWAGNVTVPRSSAGWVVTRARIASAPDTVIESRDRWGVGWKVGIVGQSQAQIAIFTNSETVRSTNVGRVSVSINGLRTLDGAAKRQVLWREGVRPAGIGWPRFVDQWAASTGDDRTPLMVVSYAQSGTGMTELMNDAETGRNWSDLVATTDWTGTDYTLFLHQWATNDQAFGSNFGTLMNALYLDTGGTTRDHSFPDVFDAGFRVAVSPPQRGTTANVAGPATQEVDTGLINYALAKGAQIAWAAGQGWAHGPHIPDAEIDHPGQGPHQKPFVARGNARVMERYALTIARGLGVDTSTDPTVSGAQFTTGTRDVIRVSFTLPNGGTLRADGGAPTGFEVNDGGAGTPTNAGFTAAIDGNTVTLAKTSGAWATGTTITYHRGGPLNYEQAAQTTLLDGVLYETYAPALEGHIPVAGGNTPVAVAAAEAVEAAELTLNSTDPAAVTLFVDATSGTLYWMIDNNASRTAAQIITGGGSASGSTVITDNNIDLGAVAAAVAPGSYNFHAVAVVGAVNSNVVSDTMTIEAVQVDPISYSAWASGTQAIPGDYAVGDMMIVHVANPTSTDIPVRAGWSNTTLRSNGNLRDRTFWKKIVADETEITEFTGGVRHQVGVFRNCETFRGTAIVGVFDNKINLPAYTLGTGDDGGNDVSGQMFWLLIWARFDSTTDAQAEFAPTGTTRMGAHTAAVGGHRLWMGYDRTDSRVAFSGNPASDPQTASNTSNTGFAIRLRTT